MEGIEANGGIECVRIAMPRRRTQREVLLEVLRLAGQYELWMTLEEMANKTKFPPASISAQLRHLRKAACGGWVVEKRRRDWEDGVWEYRVASR